MAQHSGHDGDEIAARFDQGPQALEERDVRQRSKSDGAVAGIANHPAMPPKRLEQSPAPAVTLRSQRAPVLGRLRPGERVGVERDPDWLAPRTEVPLQADREIHVLADRASVVAAGGDHRLATEQTKGA